MNKTSELRLASRMARLGAETAFEVLVKARALEAKGRDIVHLEIGEPDFDTPSNIIGAATDALHRGSRTTGRRRACRSCARRSRGRERDAPGLTQQNGYLHAGVVTTIADSACGYAAFNLTPAGSRVLSVEFKVNLLRPARGESFVARAEVIKAGRTLSVVHADVFAIDAKSGRELVAPMQGTMICLPGGGG